MIFLVSIVVPPPEITFIPEVTFPSEFFSADYGDNFTFTCRVTSLTQPTITWSTSSPITDIPGSTTTSQGNNTYTSTLTLNGVILENLGRYTCNATNEGGSNTATVGLVVYGKDLIMLIYISHILYILHSCAFLKILFLFMIVVACVHSMMYMYSILEKCNALQSGWGQISGGS